MGSGGGRSMSGLTVPDMATTTSPAQIGGAELSIGGDLPVTRLGYGTMRLTDATALGRPPAEAQIWRAPPIRARPSPCCGGRSGSG